MFAASRQYLIEHLQAAGAKRPPYTSLKRLRLCTESAQTAVLFNRETLARSGRKATYQAGDAQHRRQTLYDRTIVWDVIIGDYTAEAAEAVYTAFLSGLGKGFWADGNYIDLAATEADWVEEEDSILHAKVAVKLQISCTGPLCRDVELLPVTEYEIQPQKE